MEIEPRTLSIIERVENKQPTEDSMVEAKAGESGPGAVGGGEAGLASARAP